MDKEYIARKISNCKKLIEAAISPEQKKIYQDYLKFWTKKIVKDLNQQPKPSEAEADPEAELFVRTYPNKKAYYKRNGVISQTKAFQEFLKQLK